MIEVQHLTKRYGKCLAVDDVSFKIRNGRIYGLLGPNGAGKSSTMNMIAGCLAPTEGTVLVNGYDVWEKPIEARRQNGYLPEIPPLFPDMTPYEYLTFVAEAKGVGPELAVRQTSEAMAVTGIVGVKDKLIHTLSKGYKQRVGIAQALLGNPDIIILDEPTVGLDPKQILDIRNLIRRLGEKKTVIISSHILAEIQEMCDHVIILDHGRVVADNEIKALEQESTPSRALRMSVRGDREGIQTALRSIPGVQSVTAENEQGGVLAVSVVMESGKDLRDDIFFAMAERRYAVLSMEMQENSLEDVFLHLTGGTPEGDSERDSSGGQAVAPEEQGEDGDRA
ncbi:MAG: ABC transporter ATP-binding protein [Eubacteriales bacterium]